MLDPAEEHAVAEQFGVALAQVRRDHLISHLLAAISTHLADDVLFFGGTALSRTHAPDGRLSEDIDLISLGNRRTTAETLERTLVRATRREYPGLRWEPPPTSVREATPALLITSEGISVRIQLLSRTGYQPWPNERRSLGQRYSDAPPATLIVPTGDAFAAWKSALALVERGIGDSIVSRAVAESASCPPSVRTVGFSEPLYDTIALVQREAETLSPASRELARLAQRMLLARRPSEP
ncbi:MAG: nucleotidyl transferase AbiEii/AbiGii toxin family protein [Actinophytocola sp.]|nr:nucleotidyl transferase AbiEii/AbiGii toxin family protein [Actinophytocola sp.]